MRVRFSKYLLWVLVPVGLSVVVSACRPEAVEEPLLLLDDDPAESLPPPKGPVADNSPCLCCHTHYLRDLKPSGLAAALRGLRLL